MTGAFVFGAGAGCRFAAWGSNPAVAAQRGKEKLQLPQLRGLDPLAASRKHAAALRADGFV